ncbi:MAG: LanC-like protein [Candidatus Baltobacteraceae bacterium]
MQLFDPAEHEPLSSKPWNDTIACDFICDVVSAADLSFDPALGWPMHPEDRYGEEPRPLDRGVYSGLCGTAWTVSKLAASYGMTLRNNYAAAVQAAAAEMQVPSFFMGRAGAYASWYAIAKEEQALDGIEAAVQENAGNVTHEMFWGSPGSAIAALLVREFSGTTRFDGLLRAVQNEMWDSWRSGEEDAALLWVQDMYGRRQFYVGAGHGAFGNLTVFARAIDLLSPSRRNELHERVVALLDRYVLRDGDAANWFSLGDPLSGNRMQWCHGAPGAIISLSAYPTVDRHIETLLKAGGEGIWRAGPIRKGPGLCHGTAGNGYALLRLAQRTGDAVWLERAQRFAMHAIEQAARWRVEFGMRSYSLWTGELGVAAFADSVLRHDAAFPALELL